MATLETAADIISDAALELGLVSAAISNPYASSDPNILQLNALLDAAGRKLVREHDWQALRSTYTFPTVASTATYDLVTGFDRLIDGSVWDWTQDLPGLPISEQQFQQLSATGASLTSSMLFHIKQNLFTIYPTPSSVRTIGYAYQTSFWAAGTTSPTAAGATAAADKIWFEPSLAVALLKLKFLQAKGFPTAAAQADYERALANAKSSDGAGKVINLAGPRSMSTDPRPVDTLSVTS